MTAFPLLSDERIKSVAHAASKAGLLSWLGYEHDEAGFYTVPLLSPCHYQLARAIEAESRAPLLAEIERLTEQVKRLKADAERYQWLAGQHWVEPEAVFRLALSDTEDATEYMQELSVAIDAARAQGGE